VTSILPRLRGTGIRRADDKIAELKAKHAAEVARLNADADQLRQDVATLLNRQAASDDFFAILKHDVVTANAAWVGERTRRENAEKALVQAENAIRLRNRTIDDLKHKLDVGVNAEHVIAQTQEMEIPADLRERFAEGPVVALNQTPMARRRPDHVPGWVKDQAEPTA
jgi:hypothetical protein